MRHAAHANRCARVLENRLKEIPGIGLMFPCQANSVFVSMPEKVKEALHKRGWYFYSFIGTGGARFMCSWDTGEEDVHRLADDIADLAGAK